MRKTSLLFATLLLTSGVSLLQRSQAAPPDVVVIMADDMGYSDLGCFGGEIRTPNLDLLAEGGLRFTNFYSENMCWVSRAALLTGVYHKTSMVEGRLHRRCVTLAEALRQDGYQTYMAGKWHLAGKPYHVYPIDRGFDEFYGILGGAASFFAPAFLTRNRTNVDAEANKDPDYYITHAIGEEAERMVRNADAASPIFLYMAFTAAHWPLHAPEDEIGAYQGKYAMGWDRLREDRLARMKTLGIIPEGLPLSPRHSNVPAWKDTPHKAWQERRMEVYAAQVTAMDRAIGRLVEALKQTNRFDNTLIFFTVDNGGCHVEYGPDRKGDYLPEKTRDGRPVRPGNLPAIMPGPEDTYQSYGYGWANASNTPYRLFKQFDHEGGVRTPMIAHWPKGITSKGRLVPTVSHLIDIMPTVLDVAGDEMPSESGLETPIERDGHSLAAVFNGQDLAGHETLFFHHARGRALRHGKWKIVAVGKKPWELYDLNRDPLELQNLAEKNAQKVEELVTIWQSESDRLAKQAKLD